MWSFRPLTECDAVKDVSLEVKRGRIHALVGESGEAASQLLL